MCFQLSLWTMVINLLKQLLLAPTTADLPWLLFILGAEWLIMFLRDPLEEVLCPSRPLPPFIMQI